MTVRLVTTLPPKRTTTTTTMRTPRMTTKPSSSSSPLSSSSSLVLPTVRSKGQQQQRKLLAFFISSSLWMLYWITTNQNNDVLLPLTTTTARKRMTANFFDLTQRQWPTQAPKEMFNNHRFEQCQVVFADDDDDSTNDNHNHMALCYCKAFGGNFGDLIGPDLVKRILEYQFGCDASDVPMVDFCHDAMKDIDRQKAVPCLWSVGSVWQFVRPKDHVWGTGSFGRRADFQRSCGTSTLDSSNNATISTGTTNTVTVHSVRGPDTVQAIKIHCGDGGKSSTNKNMIRVGNSNENDIDIIPPHGDGGFLIPYIFPEYSYHDNQNGNNATITTMIEKCAILHFFDEYEAGRNTNYRSDVDKSVPPEGRLPIIQSWQTMVRNMTNCQMIASSSLHGVILADAFGIPRRWIHRNTNILPFKFYDYFRSSGGSAVPTIPQHWNMSFRTIQQAFQYATNNETLPIISKLERDDYAHNILQSFPFHLFATKPHPNARTIAIVE